MENNVDSPELNESNIYEGGSLSPINADDLKDNVIAIRQLINNHLILTAQSRQKDLQIQEYKSTIEYLKTSPFTSIIALIISLSGTIVVGISVTLCTQKDPSTYSWVLLSFGIILNLTGSLSTILYPYARKFFNKSN
ncbi:MAG TPA: hypothetical protein VK623_03445 [Flavobacterium sp.]|nr:hypothetical protein [Flavobacterium sp.]